jgi:hypothetical protein
LVWLESPAGDGVSICCFAGVRVARVVADAEAGTVWGGAVGCGGEDMSATGVLVAAIVDVGAMVSGADGVSGGKLGVDVGASVGGANVLADGGVSVGVAVFAGAGMLVSVASAVSGLDLAAEAV